MPVIILVAAPSVNHIFFYPAFKYPAFEASSYPFYTSSYSRSVLTGLKDYSRQQILAPKKYGHERPSNSRGSLLNDVEAYATDGPYCKHLQTDYLRDFASFFGHIPALFTQVCS